MLTQMEREYFEQLLNAKFSHIESNIRELKEDTESILVQTKLTNGRVTKLEAWQAQKLGEQIGEDKTNKSHHWIVGILVGVILTMATIWATQLWH